MANCDGAEDGLINSVRAHAILSKEALDNKIIDTHEKRNELHGSMVGNLSRNLMLGKFAATKKSTLITDRYTNFKLEIDSVSSKAVTDIRNVKSTKSSIDNYTRMTEIQTKAETQMDAIVKRAPLIF